jgi:uncharacterized damage-inducible protein DinB
VKTKIMKEILISSLQTSENYTLAVAAAMPEKFYKEKPVDAIWDFNELMNHIAYGIEWWTANFIKKTETPWNPGAPEKTIEKTNAYLKKAYATLRKTINEVQLSEDAVKGFYATLDHITHHRGQATVYLRLKGIIPPEYTY